MSAKASEQSQIAKLANAIKQWKKAESDLFESMRAALPVNASVRWYRGEERCQGRILSHGWNSKLKVHDFGANRILWIAVSRVIL